jgi:hypothetical protein
VTTGRGVGVGAGGLAVGGGAVGGGGGGTGVGVGVANFATVTFVVLQAEATAIRTTLAATRIRLFMAGEPSTGVVRVGM